MIKGYGTYPDPTQLLSREGGPSRPICLELD